MATFDQACPLCGKPARYSRVSSPAGKHFHCATCTEFFIDETSERRIEAMPETTRSEFRASASQHAAEGGSDRLFVLRAPRRDEEGGDGHGVARATIIGEWVSRVSRE